MREMELRKIAHMDALEHRFWAKVSIVDDDESCWEWNASRGPWPDHYGRFQWCPPDETKTRSVNAQRVSLFLTNGCVPVVACHTCDNPPCVRPSHLYDGTHQTNGADKVLRGRGHTRHQQGEANALAVLTDDKVRQARTLYREGLSYAKIGERLEVPGAAIGFAVRGQTWSHITDVLPIQPGEARRGGARLTEAQRQEVLALRAQGRSLRDIADVYGVTDSAISHLCRKHGVSPS